MQVLLVRVPHQYWLDKVAKAYENGVNKKQATANNFEHTTVVYMPPPKPPRLISRPAEPESSQPQRPKPNVPLKPKVKHRVKVGGWAVEFWGSCLK
jgi:hypothetical protein